MFTRVIILLVWLMVLLPHDLKPILDGRTSPIFLTTTYTFTDYEWAYGDVYFKAGFNVPSGKHAILDITQPVMGQVDLRNSGTLLLRGPLVFGNINLGGGNENVFLSGGTISAATGYTTPLSLAFNCNLTLTNQLQVTTDTVMDFNGHSFNLSGGSVQGILKMNDQLAARTFTVRNATVIGLEDNLSTFGPRLRVEPFAPVMMGGPAAGTLHTYDFANSLLYFSAANAITFDVSNTITVTGYKLQLSGVSDLACARNTTGTVNIYTSMIVNNLTQATIGPHVKLNFSPQYLLSDNRYLQLPVNSSLKFVDSDLSFDRRMSFMLSPFIVEGTMNLTATSTGSIEQTFTMGDPTIVAPGTAAKYDLILDIQPNSHLIVNTAKIVNGNAYN